MVKTRLNSLIICCFFLLLLTTGILFDCVEIAKGINELDIKEFLLYRLLYLILAAGFYLVSRVKNTGLVDKFFSIGIVILGVVSVVDSPPGSLNGMFVLSFGVILFTDVCNLWRNKKYIVFVIFLHICLYVVFGAIYSCSSMELVNTGCLNMVMVSFLYSHYYKDKVRYFE